MRNVTIVESNVEPNKEHLWFYNGKLKWFGPNGWEEINPQVMSPTTTPKPVVTTTTSTPVPTTTTSTAPPLPTFKLTNNTGEVLTISAMGYVEGEISTVYPLLADGISIPVLKSNEYVYLNSDSYYQIGILVDGEDRGGLILAGSNSYKIPQSVFMNATEIIVYNVNAATTTTTTTSSTTPKPNVK